MEQFYRKNVARYHKLVAALDPFPKPRISNGTPDANMIVSARIRPLAEDEGFPCAMFSRSNQKNVVDVLDLYNHPRSVPVLRSSDYQVDRLYDSTSTTDEIYDDLVHDLVPFAWSGGIGTLFAYGQTGSGKTFTISRLEELVAETLMKGSLEGGRDIYMTFIELAGNAAFDLLSGREPISLLQDSDGTTQMVGVEEHQVSSLDDMSALVDRANSFRRTEPTLKNPVSSRSHAICRIRIQNSSDGSDGLLYLIDLAGSESARDVAVHGADRMRETKQINISLSVLKDCIRGKAQANAAPSGQKPPHIPFRQSALTRVMKHVFDPASSRPCKTVVIACVTPSLADVGPSKNTLRFAEMLRVSGPAGHESDAEHKTEEKKTAMTWSNAELRQWIKENSGTPPILDNIVAPRESGAKFFDLSSREIDYRCQKCPGVKAKQAQAFRAKLWEMYI
ncbi:P-loop containing nucleoside triphosphate hydrolase protein [Paraphoma chrysanthemicola]|uniref:P-loop containing nucleoside triphosphate hydrolase protein n=1 Tax=Paraphoma chrysanthemicola TaxID=798071 RepID=A0A8K0R4R4_9PLEO|nr:P-loop containing nucleoside triphosphate hydrolase protein [Paraphoma chrysanthemicola]